MFCLPWSGGVGWAQQNVRIDDSPLTAADFEIGDSLTLCLLMRHGLTTLAVLRSAALRQADRVATRLLA